jgi:hypothetical protein
VHTKDSVVRFVVCGSMMTHCTLRVNYFPGTCSDVTDFSTFAAVGQGGSAGKYRKIWAQPGKFGDWLLLWGGGGPSTYF